MNKIYFLIIGNEYGYDICNQVDIPLLTKDEADALYETYLDEYDCVAMFKIWNNKIVSVKEINNLI